MNENLATIQKVVNVRAHPNADALDLVQVLGWQVVTKRGEYKDGDLCVYVVIDTVLPERHEFEFLRNKHFRIKPIRLRGEESAGIVFPLTIIPHYLSHTSFGCNINVHSARFDFADAPEVQPALLEVGTDITNMLNIKHYEKPVPPELAGQAHGGIPGFLIVTDEDNLRTYPDAVPEMFGRPFYITRKEDGSSGTFYIKGGEFGVCSRRVHLKDTESNGFWKIARKYDIENVLRKSFPDTDVAIQGEVVGPGIQKNRLGLKELELRVFNLFDIVKRTYMECGKLIEFTSNFNIPMVPIIMNGVAFGYTLEELIKLANEQKYSTGGPAEGIVIRPKDSFYSNILKKSWSGKVLNENYNE